MTLWLGSHLQDMLKRKRASDWSLYALVNGMLTRRTV